MPSSTKLLIVLQLLVLLNTSVIGQIDSDRVQVNINSDSLDGTVQVPRWVLSQAGQASLGLLPTNNWSYDDGSLPSSIRREPEWYQIRINLYLFDQDNIRVKIIDSNTIRVEARRRQLSTYGGTFSRTVSRTFSIPRSYNVYQLTTNINDSGILVINVPNRDGGAVTINGNGDRYIRVGY